jgi:LL-diaminopimelate aminotransferase
VRCGLTVVPKTLKGRPRDGAGNAAGEKVDLHRLWYRRQTTKFNGVSYITQRGAEACYSDSGRQQVRGLVQFYLENARLIREGLSSIGLKTYGGVNAPYVWVKTPDGLSSWDAFDLLLNKAHVVVTPGSGFGISGEGYFRVSAFNSRPNVVEAVGRLKKAMAG